MPSHRKTRGDETAEPKRAALAVPRLQADEAITEQIKVGQELLQRQLRDEGSLRTLERDATTWREYTRTLLAGLFTSDEYLDEFSFFGSGVISVNQSLRESWQDEMNEIAESVRRLESIQKRLPLIREDSSVPRIAEPTLTNQRSVFVVHGQNEAVKQSVARFLEKLKLEAVILHEQANKGQTLIEKFEAHAQVGYAVVLLTPDDKGGLEADPPDKYKSRARQNVILELGYFIGKLGRGRVCALHMGDVELPSDIHGVAYVRYDATDAWKLSLAREMKAAGIDVDLNLVV
jgi:predicted nucleotide-binding protein